MRRASGCHKCWHRWARHHGAMVAVTLSPLSSALPQAPVPVAHEAPWDPVWPCARGAAAAWFRRLHSASATTRLSPVDRDDLCGLLALALADPALPATVALGLSPDQLRHLGALLCPDGLDALGVGWSTETGEDAVEEPDLRRLLGEHGAPASPLAALLVPVIARRCRWSRHLWVAMGVRSRPALAALFQRHFPSLAAARPPGMRWKRYLYRNLCADTLAVVCKSPECEGCEDYPECFDEPH